MPSENSESVKKHLIYLQGVTERLRILITIIFNYFDNLLKIYCVKFKKNKKSSNRFITSAQSILSIRLIFYLFNYRLWIFYVWAVYANTSGQREKKPTLLNI